MQRQSLEFKQEIVRKLLRGKITTKTACEQLGCVRQTIYRYLEKIAVGGLVALKDGRLSLMRSLNLMD